MRIVALSPSSTGKEEKLLLFSRADCWAQSLLFLQARDSWSMSDRLAVVRGTITLRWNCASSAPGQQHFWQVRTGVFHGEFLRLLGVGKICPSLGKSIVIDAWKNARGFLLLGKPCRKGEIRSPERVVRKVDSNRGSTGGGMVSKFLNVCYPNRLLRLQSTVSKSIPEAIFNNIYCIGFQPTPQHSSGSSSSTKSSVAIE